MPASPRRSQRSLPALLALAVAVVALAAGCASLTGVDAGPGSTGPSGSTAGGALRVVATTSILADLARQVGGDRVEVETVIKANVDAHDFEPAPADIEAIADADVVLRNGVGLEAWFDDIVETAEPAGLVVDTSEGVGLRTGDHEGADPHIWQSPANVEVMVGTVADAFAEADPAGADTYRQHADRYRAELQELDRWVADQLSALTNRKVVTNHDALGYYLDRYGLELVGTIIPSFDSTAELSAADVDAVVAAIRADGVTAVFSESAIPPETAEAIGTEAGVNVVAGEDALYGDSLGPAGSDAATYVDMIRHNTEVLVANLR